MKRFILLCYMFLITLLPVYSENYNEFDASQLYKHSVDSMLYIETQDTTGSGVIVKSDGTFVTCFHVIANADYITVKMNDGSYYNVNGFRYINPLEDIAILTLDTKRIFKPIKIEPLNYLEIGEKIYTISNPQGMQFVFSDGMLNQYNEDYIQFSAPISPGSSGGALLNKWGELIGIVDAYIKLEGSQNMNLAVPNKYWKYKLDNEKIVNKNNLKWIDFVVQNASEDQYKLYSDYMFLKLNEADFVSFYKYLKTLAQYYGTTIPVDLYVVFGYYAFWAGEFEDAIQWYELSYQNKQYEEASIFSLCILYLLLEKQDKFERYCVLLYQKYPKSFKKLDEFSKSILKCNKFDETCIASIALEMIEYIAEISKFNKE